MVLGYTLGRSSSLVRAGESLVIDGHFVQGRVFWNYLLDNEEVEGSFPALGWPICDPVCI